jgi:hypothetical protein
MNRSLIIVAIVFLLSSGVVLASETVADLAVGTSTAVTEPAGVSTSTPVVDPASSSTPPVSDGVSPVPVEETPVPEFVPVVAEAVPEVVAAVVEEAVLEDPAPEVPSPLVTARPDRLEKQNWQKSAYTKRISLTGKTPSRHSCSAASFTLKVSASNEYSVVVSAKRGDASRSGSLYIGDLPYGFEATFDSAPSNLAAVSMASDSATLKIKTSSEAQKGSFSVPIIFTESDASNDSAVVCQINILSK